MQPCGVHLLLAILFLVAISEAQKADCGLGLIQHNVSNVILLEEDNPVIKNAVGNPGWAITVDEDRGSAKTSLWYTSDGHDTGNRNSSSPFDACAWLVWDFPSNVLHNEDEGSCTQAFSTECRDALHDKITASALKWSISNSTTHALSNNHSKTSSDQICTNIRDDFRYDATASWPQECWQDFRYNPRENDTTDPNFYNDVSAIHNFISWDSITLTGDGKPFLSTNCTVNGGGHSFNNVLVNGVAAPQVNTLNDPYAGQCHSMYMAISVYLSAADPSSNASVQPWATTKLACLYPTHFNDFSRPVAPLTNSIAINDGGSSGHHFTKAEIAGLVLGLFAIVCGLVSLTILLIVWRRRRKQRKEAEALDEGRDDSDRNSTTATSDQDMRKEDGQELSGEEIIEMRDNPVKLEPDSSTITEMNPGEDWLVELPGDNVHAQRATSTLPKSDE